ncbi:MAG: hypothetical protein AAGA58_08460 [Verrucomicrobiota bacterium]
MTAPPLSLWGRIRLKPHQPPLIAGGSLFLCMAAIGIVLSLPLIVLPCVAFAFLCIYLAFQTEIYKPFANWTFNNTIFVFYVFFLFQDIIILNMERFGLPFGSLVKKSDEGILLAVGIYVCYRRILMQKPVRLHYILLFPVLLGVWSIASKLVNEVPNGVVLLDIFLLTKGFLVFLIAMNADFGPKTIKNFLKANMVIALIAVFIEFVQIPFPALAELVFGVEPMYRSGSVRPTGPFEHPGTLGTFLAFNLCLFFGFAYSYKSKKTLIFYGITTVALVLSLTIRQFTGHFAGMVLFLAIRNRIMLLKFLGVAMLGLPLATPIIIKNIENLKKNDVGFVADTVRVQAYKLMGDILEEKPFFGEGPGRFGGFVSISSDSPVLRSRVFDFLNQELSSLDAYWPHIFGELGYVGGGVFVLMLIVIFFVSLAPTKEGIPLQIRAIAVCCTIALPMGIFDATVAPFYENTFAALLMYSQLGLMCGALIHYQEKRRRAAALKPTPEL